MRDDLRPINVVGASAGTGKTYRLASDFAGELRTKSAIRASQIIATTFTNKAADELAERIRRMLLKDGRWEDAQAVLAGYVGTVNSICGRLVSELVIDAGLCPSVQVIAEERQAEVFSIAVESVTNSYATELWSIANRLGKDDWREDVREVAEMARQNDLSLEELKLFAERSWQRYQKVLPVAANPVESAAITESLLLQLNGAIEAIEASGDGTRVTAESLEILKDAQRNLAIPEEVPWHTWAKLAKIRTAKSSQVAVVPLVNAARAHLWHDGFQNDIHALIRSVFSCASDCLSLYQDFKSERGLIDFVDQERIALSILRNPQVHDSLTGRFHKLFVDEFQDTSPIQLAVFLELARIVETSTWVGDEKQSIFGFRGADPELMQEVVEKLVPITGGTRDSLKTSYRSRPELVKFVNHVFGCSLPLIGIRSESIQITNTYRGRLPQLNHPLHVWWLQGTTWKEAMAALAFGIRELLSERDGWPVTERSSDDTRPIIGSDIAILCRSNDRRLALADALANAGITVATQRSNLLDRPECVLAIAVLRFLVDPYDTLAAGEILRLTCEHGQETGWLSAWMEKGYDDARQKPGCLNELDNLRSQLIGMTPVEAVELATASPIVLSKIKGWGKVRQRMLNLDALRGLAIRYEELCLTRRGAATPAGLVTFLCTEVSDPVQPANPDEDAIQILTYYKAKGLEWPLVIMFDLDSPPPATPFGAFVEKAADGFDPVHPLAGRSISYWPWPYGQQKANLDITDNVLRSPEMISARRRHAGGNLRLLYVGMTRPRDYLIFSCRPTTSGTGWLNMIQNTEGVPVLSLPVEEGCKQIVNSAQDFTAYYRILSPPSDNEGKANAVVEIGYEQPSLPGNGVAIVPYSGAPSSVRSLASGRVERRYYLGDRLTFSESIDIRILGEALHRFLATDDPHATDLERITNASSIAERWNLIGLGPEQFVEASNRLRRQLEKMYPGAAWMREWPVVGRIDGQRMQGTIDLLLQASDGFLIVDHKSFPGPHALWEEQAISHFSQLNTYAQLVRQATGEPTIHLYIHMPIVGTLLKLV